SLPLLEDSAKDWLGLSSEADNAHAVGKKIIAGMLAHHKGLAGILCPTVNSGRRSQPASLAGYWANWGYDHRSVTVRIPEASGHAARIEHRMADGGANPYTAAAALLHAGLLGDEKTLPNAETLDGLENVSTSEHIAENLGDALTDLEADKKLVAAIGQGLIDNHVFNKRCEIAEVAALSPEQEVDYYRRYL
nr:glutamine synthetase [Alphaproteobacteria bacterium]